MDASPLLHQIARALAECRLEAVLVGNAAAALHGAPVTTLDFDFMFRKTPLNLRKLKKFASSLGAMVLRPYYPVSSLYRVVNDELGLQCDFMSQLHGVRSFAGLRSRGTAVSFGGCSIVVADLKDVVGSKRASGRPRKHVSDALRKESERVTDEQIRRLLRLPMERRTHFLRVRVPGGGSHL